MSCLPPMRERLLHCRQSSGYLSTAETRSQGEEVQYSAGNFEALIELKEIELEYNLHSHKVGCGGLKTGCIPKDPSLLSSKQSRQMTIADCYRNGLCRVT